MKTSRILTLTTIALLFLAACQSSSDQGPAPTAIPLADPQTGAIDSSVPIVPPQEPISLPPGFGVTVYADGLGDPRMMAFGPDGHLYVSFPSAGEIRRFVDSDQDGISDQVELVAENLLEPSGLAFFEDGSLYVAETTRILRLMDPEGDGSYQEREIITAGIAAGGNTNRSIIFSPDWQQLYLAIGSSCNVCLEEDRRRAGVMRFNADGSEGRIFTEGLRYVIGMDFRPDRDILWVANIEREGLKGDLPPETLYAIYADADAGWPYCHAGRIVDPDFGNRDSCSDDLLTPIIELEAHSAPYGMTFYTGDQFPAEFQQDVFIALHGTGSGSSARGYKIIRIPLGGGEPEPLAEDFATGWIGEEGDPWGTPADIIQGPDGSLFVSDDLAGAVYRIFYAGP